MNVGKVVAHIPARGGSKRVPAKNLRFLAGRPMIAYAIEAALGSPLLDDVYLNTDSETLASLGSQLGCNVYRRPSHLGSDEATGDDFTIDFIDHVELDTLVMISPVCPLVQSKDITDAIEAFASSDVDTLISCTETRMQTFCDGRAINVDLRGPLAPSQANPPIAICNWAVTVWNGEKFRELYREFKGGYFGDRRMLWPMDPLRAVKVSEERDFRLAEALLIAQRGLPAATSVRYWSEADGTAFAGSSS